MSNEEQTNVIQDQKQNDKEFNFRQIERKLMEEKAERERLIKEKEQLAREIQELKMLHLQKHSDEDEEDSEPYVDRKRLKKEQAKFSQQFKQETKSEIQQAIQLAIQEERKKSYLDKNPDFYNVIQEHAEKLLNKDPELAEIILKMPEGFERQQLVYKNIKVLGLDKPEVKHPSIQEKIDANRRSPYYQPTGIANAPYAAAGDFTPAGQKNAYQKMQELKTRLRI